MPFDFEFDGRLVADTQDPGTLSTLIKAQLLFTIGQLNGDRSVGRLGLLELSEIRAMRIVPPPPAGDAGPPADDAGAPAADAGPPADDAGPPATPPPPPQYDVSYHAKLPVAWAGPTKPTRYTFTLPARLSEADQVTFAAKYGGACVDPADGPAGAGHMFVVYRPQQSGCALAPEDVVTFTADVTPSVETTREKYPEYHRVWEDGALDVVALFSHEYSTPTQGDEGALAYDAFVSRMREYMLSLQPDGTKRVEPSGLSRSPSKTGASTVRLAAELPDGRSMKVDVRLVSSSLAAEGPAFDEWYNGVTPSADIILYNGHAGLGANVRSLMEKGSFRSGQYVIWFANGCDTLAYVDRTLVTRRALLNPDDPNGTKYMDTVTNVMAGYFSELEATGATFLRAFVEVRYPEVGPKTYAQILKGIDPAQVVVVTGEEDNQLEPLPPSPHPPGPAPSGPQTGPSGNPAADPLPTPTTQSPARDRDGGCGVTGSRDVGFGAAGLGVLFVALFARRHVVRFPLRAKFVDRALRPLRARRS